MVLVTLHHVADQSGGFAGRRDVRPEHIIGLTVAPEDGWIVVEMPTVQRLRVHPVMPVGQLDQREGVAGTDESEESRRDHLDTDVGASTDTQ
jgi:hypothetical protein